MLQDNGGDNLTVSANGSFTFATAVASGTPCSVTVKTSPAGQTCTVASGSGTMRSANVTNVAVSCTNNPTFSVDGTVLGLSGTVVLQDNGGDNLSVNANGSFTFATAVASGAAYSVTVQANPSGQACSVANGSGTMGSANVTNVAVTCATTTPGSDNFNRPNGSLGPSWTDISDGGLAIVSQAAAGTAASGISGDIRAAESYTSDQYSQVTVTSTQLTGTQSIGPMVRAQNSGQTPTSASTAGTTAARSCSCSSEKRAAGFSSVPPTTAGRSRPGPSSTHGSRLHPRLHGKWCRADSSR